MQWHFYIWTVGFPTRMSVFEAMFGISKKKTDAAIFFRSFNSSYSLHQKFSFSNFYRKQPRRPHSFERFVDIQWTKWISFYVSGNELIMVYVENTWIGYWIPSTSSIDCCDQEHFAVNMLSSKLNVHWFFDFHYYHHTFFSQKQTSFPAKEFILLFLTTIQELQERISWRWRKK